MASIRRILVAVKDPSARTQPALRKAAQLASGLGAQLELFHAISEPILVDAVAFGARSMKDVEGEWRDRHVVRLERMAAPLREQGLKVSVACEWDFPAFEAIVRRAERSRCDLIVAERHAKRHLAPWLLRFNDWELLRRSPLPVLLVKSGRMWKKPVVLAAVDPGHSFAKPAKLDAAILDAGLRVVEALGGTLHAVHAFSPSVIDANQLDFQNPNLWMQIESQAAQHSRGRFERAVAVASLPPSRLHLVGRHPADAIPDVARRTKASIVVMGAISRSGLKRLVIGDTAERILDALSCDVLVIKPAQFKSRVPARSRGVQWVASPGMI